MKHLKCWFLALCCVGSVPGWCNAGFIPAVDFSGGLAAGDGGSLGYSFTTGSTAVTIDGLGAVTGATVRIYLSGTTTNLASVTITSSSPTSSPANGHSYSYEAIPLLTLLPNTTYDIVSDVDPRQGVFVGVTTIVNAAGITLGGAVSSAFTGQFPTDSPIFGGGPFFGPSFDVGTGITTAAPEPASLTLLGIGGAGLVGFGWRRRRQSV